MCFLIRDFANIVGWQTSRHLVVLESDDWGSIRMPSIEVFNDLCKEGLELSADEGYRFNRYDSLATNEDLSLLFEVLTSAKDSTGRPAVMTPVCVVANPDFSKIIQTDFTEYHYEPFVETLKKYPGCENSFSLWQEGLENRLFVPQFHGREHLNVLVWMKALQNRHEKARKAFDHKMWGITVANDPSIGVEFQAAFDFINPADISYHEEVISSGLNLFERLFGYRATYFVPPNGPFSSRLEPVCSEEGIRFLSSSKIQNEPTGYGKNRKRFHWLGQVNRSGLIYLTRNCFFEPGTSGKNYIDDCLKEISVAFRWHKPAVISSHRVNYIGALYKDNRGKGLLQLSSLLKQIKLKWPDVEFLTSSELGELIADA